jgi:hypothetical protein
VAVGAIAATDGGASNGDGPSTTPSARSPSILSAVEGQVDGEDYPDELRVFDYIYGVLHSPDYRATYAQFLKIDFQCHAVVQPQHQIHMGVIRLELRARSQFAHGDAGARVQELLSFGGGGGGGGGCAV